MTDPVKKILQEDISKPREPKTANPKESIQLPAPPPKKPNEL
jgi:hypothetical protein